MAPKKSPKKRFTEGKPLTPRRQRFVEEYVIDLNATQAAIRAGYSAASADRIANELLGIPAVQAAIAEKRAIISEKAEISATDVLKRLVAIVYADPNEIVSHRIGACRYCHGIGHGYQWASKAEYGQAVATALLLEQTPPTQEGGFGYRVTAKPHHECPVCCGEGAGRVRIEDTRKLSPKAAVLYAGVKKTKDGTQVLLHDQMKALELLGRHLGMFNDKLQLKGDSKNPLMVLIEQVQGSAFKPVGKPVDGVKPPQGSAIGPKAEPEGDDE